jgi:hypothetical protein
MRSFEVDAVVKNKIGMKRHVKILSLELLSTYLGGSKYQYWVS